MTLNIFSIFFWLEFRIKSESSKSQKNFSPSSSYAESKVVLLIYHCNACDSRFFFIKTNLIRISESKQEMITRPKSFFLFYFLSIYILSKEMSAKCG